MDNGVGVGRNNRAARQKRAPLVGGSTATIARGKREDNLFKSV